MARKTPMTMPAPIVVVPSAQHPAPPQKPKWLESMQSLAVAKPQEDNRRELGLLETLAGTVLANGTGAALGLLNAELKDGLDVNGKPLDAGLGALSLASAVIFRSRPSLAISEACFAVFQFRKVDALRTAIKEFRGMAEAKPAAETDPVIDLEKELG